MFTITDVLLGGILPAVVAAGLMWMACAIGMRPSFAWPISLAAGCIAGQIGLAARAGLGQTIGSVVGPRVAHDWLPLLIVAAAMSGIVAGAGRQRMAAGLAGATCVITPALFLWRSVYAQHDWSPFQTTAYLSLLAMALAAVWSLLAAPRPNDQSFVRATLIIVVALGTAAVLGMSGSFSYAQLAGASAAALVGAKLASLRGRYLEGLNNAAGVITLTVGSYLLLGYFFADLTAMNAVLLAMALVVGGGWLPMAKLPNPVWQIGVRILACLVPLSVALILAYRAFADAI